MKLKNKKVFAWGIILFCLLLTICGVFFLIQSGVFNNNKKEEIDIITPRTEMSRAGYELSSKKADGQEFLDTMTGFINSAKDEKLKKSFEIYFIYLSARHGFFEEAMQMSDEQIENESELSAAHKCELRQYRKLASKNYISTLYNAEKNDTEMTEYCNEALELVENKQLETESDFGYAMRMYYSGFLDFAIELMEKIDKESLNEEEYNAMAYQMLDYYYLTGDAQKYMDLAKIDNVEFLKGDK